MSDSFGRVIGIIAGVFAILLLVLAGFSLVCMTSLVAFDVYSKAYCEITKKCHHESILED